jgi:hypothetical protein
MSSPISLNGNIFDWNPAEDSGWLTELVVGKQHPPGAAYTILQVGGTQSAVRKYKGITRSTALKDAIMALLGLTVAFTDQFGASNTVFVEAFEPRMIMDITNGPNYIDWQYDLTLVKVT